MEDYKKLVEQLRATVSVSKRKMLDEAADAIEYLQAEFDNAAVQAEKSLLQMERMTLGDAYAIFANIDTVELADEVKGLAVWKIARMETHNGVTKDMMVKVIRWLLELAFEVSEVEPT